MTASFVAGFGPVVRDTDASQAFWRPGLGIELSPEGLLVGVTHTPWMHADAS